ncbi:MAG: hypothetical protein AAGN82_28345 [Myxococcota bacterium]
MNRITILGTALAFVFGASAFGSGCTVKRVADDDSDDDGGSGGQTSGGQNGATGTGGSAATGGGTCSVAATDACSTCMSDSCCEAYVTCENDPDCWSCVTGVEGENGDTCGANPALHAKQRAYLECLGGPCNAECIGEAGECTEAAAEFQGSCGGCLEQNCCEPLGACFAHEGCWTDCVTDHNPSGCHEPTAHALYYALGDCARASCEDECF